MNMKIISDADSADLRRFMVESALICVHQRLKKD